MELHRREGRLVNQSGRRKQAVLLRRKMSGTHIPAQAFCSKSSFVPVWFAFMAEPLRGADPGTHKKTKVVDPNFLAKRRPSLKNRIPSLPKPSYSAKKRAKRMSFQRSGSPMPDLPMAPSFGVY
jgi:hypothetical protein